MKSMVNFSLFLLSVSLITILSRQSIFVLICIGGLSFWCFAVLKGYPRSILNILSNVFCRSLKHCGCLNLHIAKTVAVRGNRIISALFVTNATLMTTLILKWCTASIVTTGFTPSVKASLWISMSACGIYQRTCNSFVDSAARISWHHLGIKSWWRKWKQDMNG